MPDEIIQVLTTIDSEAAAGAIADELIRRHVAACVQVLGPIRSSYRWEGEIERAEEWLLLIKSNLASYARLEAVIRELHSYDVPEILAFPVVAGNQDYINWLTAALENDG
jgi:periplasmic divalent cation tolerance protein